ncbi:MAG: aminopeptidase [Clostridiales bacterium]|nr:aminopeptidase [Clostridiales bacterium]
MDLNYERKNIYKNCSKQDLQNIFDFCEGYKDFLNKGKTEREACAYAVKLCEENGYKPFTFAEKLKVGDKRYFLNRDKSIFIVKIGTEDIEKEGVKIMAAHVDSPRLDLKPNPLYEDAEIAYLKTHYYGGIKKYQWTTIPLALHGVVMLRGGKKMQVCVGEDESDPVFCITDILPHLSAEQNAKPIATAISGEALNAMVGGVYDSEDEENSSVKNAILKLLNQKYGITEVDFQCSELCFVPAGVARDVGFDKAFLSSYGHDDKVCAYPELKAILDSDDTHTVIAVFADKEETGSDGVTGMQSRVFSDVLNTVCASLNANPMQVRYKSKCISADVNAGYDPHFAEAYEKRNSAYLSCGVDVSKYTGSRGKGGTSDANAELVAYFRDLFDDNGVVWQIGEIGKIDVGGGGTVAKFIANMGIDTLDIGVAVLSMHAPYEIVSKADVYEIYKAMLVFCNGKN